MAWTKIEDTSGLGIGILVSLKNGESEKFVNRENIRFVAQKWDMEDYRDKSDGEIHIGYYGESGKWTNVAIYPANSYSFVKILFS